MPLHDTQKNSPSPTGKITFQKFIVLFNYIWLKRLYLNKLAYIEKLFDLSQHMIMITTHTE